MTDDTDLPLNELLIEANLAPLEEPLSEKFVVYLDLLLRWNQKVNLTAIRDVDGILRRHFVESIACARALPVGIDTLLDFGSGAGFPGIPIGLCRPEIAVTLAESQNKKAAFLREVVRVLEITAMVHAGRAEAIQRKFDCVMLRAVDRMEAAIEGAMSLVAEDGCLGVMTTGEAVPALVAIVGKRFRWCEPLPFPFGDNRLLVLARRIKSQDCM